MENKRKSLKQLLLSRIILVVALIIFVITLINIKMHTADIVDLTESVLGRESITYSDEIYNWWSLVEGRVSQIAEVYKNSPDMTYDETLKMLLALTEKDPDSQDIYIGYGDDMTFLDGSGWVPDDTFVFTDRAWYQGAIEKNGEIYTSDPYVDASTGKTCLACSIMLDENVVLSSDVNFDKMAEKLKAFKASSPDAKFYIINKDSQDILLSNDESVVGTTVAESEDPIMKGLATIYDSMNTDYSFDSDKVVATKTDNGKMLYVGTVVKDTSWLIVSATPYSFISGRIAKTVVITFIISILLLVLLAVIQYIIISKHLDPVSRVSGKITDLSNGDFTSTVTLEGNDEITTLSEQLNGYITRMREMLFGLTDIANDMNKSAEECYNISHELTNSSSSQGEAIEKLNDTLNGMSNSIDDIANAATELATISSGLSNNSEQVRQLCIETMKSSEDGRDEMRVMTGSVATLNETIGELIDIIRVTGETVDQITGITVTISEISSQTNLLSLNASIEAARAGELGKGFAVVANEVGALASQSSEATDNISKLVDTITKNIVEINKKADVCMKDMEKCMSVVERSNASFDTICEDITKATDAIHEIADGVNRINDVASNNAAVTEEQAATISQILELSESIVEDSNSISEETGNLSSVSERISGYSGVITDDLHNFTLD